jgi:Zn-dependent protease
MPTAFRVARIRGVDLRIDPSWAVIFALLTWGLATSFASIHPSWSTGLTLLVGALAALSFFASVLIHELAHTVMASAWGIPVHDITLHLFGGLSTIERDPPTPKAELWIAIVGPIASVCVGLFALGAAALLLSTNTVTADAPLDIVRNMGPTTSVLFWLAGANFMVAGFNMLPGLPLDGGRVLRAAIWSATGDLQRATRAAAIAGQVVGWALIALGLFMAMGGAIPLLGTGLLGGLWMALIGWVVRTAAAQSFRGALLEDMLAGIRSMDLMRTDGPWVAAGLPVKDLVDRMLMRDEGRAFPVFEGKSMVGLVSWTDVRRVGADEREATVVREIMTPRDRLLTTAADEPIIEALKKLRRADVAQLPVVSPDGELAGVLFERDVARWIELYAGAESVRRPASTAASAAPARL